MTDKTNPVLMDPLRWSGMFLIALGLFHIPVWILDGSDWEGSVSWRKPILFGVSTGLTLWSLSWLQRSFCGRPRLRLIDRWGGWMMAFALVLEVGLITLQAWRGEASHFNQSTELNGAIDGWMLALICIAFVGITYYAVRTFGKLKLENDYALSARVGMLFLVASCLIGFVISSYGYRQTIAGLPPETVGESGVAKFPHGVAIHAIQIFPAMVFLMRWFPTSTNLRVVVVRWLSLAMLCQIIFASYQTMSGFARYDIQTSTGVALIVAAWLCALFPLARLMVKRRRLVLIKSNPRP